MKTLFFLTIALCLMTRSAHARSNVHMIGDIPSSEQGLCLGLPKGRKGAVETISKERTDAVLKRLREMKMDARRFLDPLTFNYVVANHGSNQFGGNRILYSMGCLDQNNTLYACPVSTGTVAHEIGHWIGHTMDIRGKTAYEAFRASAFRTCRGFDGYSTHRRNGQPHNNDLNETFAEVFSGYITAPNFLKAECLAGYEFMRDQVFKGEMSKCPDPEKPKIPLPRPRPAEAPGPVPLSDSVMPATLVEPGVPPSPMPAADGEHPIPLPRPRPAGAPAPAIVVPAGQPAAPASH